jgi:transcriptional regulator with XRE-family HTH domain
MWRELIVELVAAGLSEREIADKVGVAQPTINRIKLGRRKRVEHETGELLLKLHRQVLPMTERRHP